MPRRRCNFLMLLPILLLPMRAPAQTTPAATGPAPLPALVDIQAQITAAQYRDALKNILRILDLKGPAAAPYDRPTFFLLRAECQLQLRQLPAAQDALDSAVKEARTANPQNAEAAAQALALSVLITKSPNLTYLPRTRTGPIAPKPISILDHALRPAAFKALYDDSLPDLKAKVRAMDAVTTMNPILDLAKSICALRGIESLGTGGNAESTALSSDLTLRASTLLSVSLGNMHSTVNGITLAANQTYTTPMVQSDLVTGARNIAQVPHRRGLVTEDVARLKSIQQTANQIRPACIDLSLHLAAPATFQALAADADTVLQQANKTLNDDYTRMP